MRREDDQRLWDLLGESAEAPASPFFARNVLREVRRQSSGWVSMFSTRRLKWLAPATAVALAVFSTVYFTHLPGQPNAGAEASDDPVAKLDTQDYEVVAELDDLIAVDDNTLWTESTSR
jgi:hypothetical protein